VYVTPSSSSSVTFEGSSPAVGPDGTIYIGATDGNLYAISSTGSLEWTFAATGPAPGGYSFATGIQSSPVVGPDGTIYFGSENGYLYAITPPSTPGGSATLDWDYLTGQPPAGSANSCGAYNGVPCGIFTSSPALSPTSSTVYIGGEDGNLYAVSPPTSPGSTTGALVWKTFLPLGYAGDVVNTPVVTPDGTTVYVTQQSGTLYAVNSATGSVNWKYYTGDEYSSPSIGPDGTVYDAGCAYAPGGSTSIPGDGSSVWTSCSSGFAFASSAPAVDVNGMVYEGGHPNTGPDPGMFAFFPSQGIGAWYFDTGSGSTVGSPIIGSDGTIYFDVVTSAGTGTLYAIGGTTSPRSTSTPLVNSNVALTGQATAYGLAVNPSNGQVFASGCSDISVIDGSSNAGGTANQVIQTITAPPGVCFYGDVFDTTNGELYAIDVNNDAVVAIDGSTYSIVDQIPLGTSVSNFAQSMAFDSANGDIYVSTNAAFEVVIDGSTNTILTTVTLPHFSASQTAAYDPSNEEVYVGTEGSGLNGVAIIDGSSNSGPTANTVVDTIPLSSSAYLAGSAYDPANGDVYFSDINLDSIFVVDGATNTLTTQFALSTPDRDYEAWAIAYDSLNNLLYVAGYDTSVVPVINGSTNTVVSVIAAPGWPISIAFDPVNGDVYFGNSDSSSYVSVIFGPSTRTTTSTTVTCIPGTVLVGQGSTCTADVTGGGATPTGTVDFTGPTGEGSFSSPDPCSLSATTVSGESSCGVTYTASSASAATQTITAQYSGDGSYSSSSGSFSLSVSVSTTTTTSTSTSSSTTVSVSCQGGSSATSTDYGVCVTPGSISQGGSVGITGISGITTGGYVFVVTEPDGSNFTTEAFSYSCSSAPCTTTVSFPSDFTFYLSGASSVASTTQLFTYYVSVCSSSGFSGCATTSFNVFGSSTSTTSTQSTLTGSQTVSDSLAVGDTAEPPTSPLSDALSFLDGGTGTVFGLVSRTLTDTVHAMDSVSAPPGPLSDALQFAEKAGWMLTVSATLKDALNAADNVVGPAFGNLVDSITAIDKPSFSSTAVVQSTTGKGAIKFATSAGVIDVTPLSGPTTGVPSGMVPGYGFYSFKIMGLSPGQTVTLTMTFPKNLTPGARWMKFDGTQQVTNNYPTTIKGNVMAMQLTDGVYPGDMDGSKNGQIADPGTLITPTVPASAPSLMVLVALTAIVVTICAALGLLRHGRNGDEFLPTN
jgi:outer membrane protein assembly factor BamB